MQTSFANQTFYQPMLQLTRISMLLFYLTCLGKETRMTCIGLIVLSALFGVACTVVEFLQCSPTSMLWTGVRPATYKCIDQPQFFRISGLINLICKRLSAYARRRRGAECLGSSWVRNSDAFSTLIILVSLLTC